MLGINTTSATQAQSRSVGLGPGRTDYCCRATVRRLPSVAVPYQHWSCTICRRGRGNPCRPVLWTSYNGVTTHVFLAHCALRHWSLFGCRLSRAAPRYRPMAERPRPRDGARTGHHVAHPGKDRLSHRRSMHLVFGAALLDGRAFDAIPFCRPSQERNLKHPDDAPEGRRMTAAARRKLGSLSTAIDGLDDTLNSPDSADV